MNSITKLLPTNRFRFLAIQLRYKYADKSLARPGKKQAAATEEFEFH